MTERPAPIDTAPTALPPGGPAAAAPAGPGLVGPGVTGPGRTGPGPQAVPGFDALLGFTLAAASGDEVVGRLEVGPQLHQPFGIVHGGVYCTLVETAASIGAGQWFGQRGTVAGVSNHTDFLRAVREGVLEVRARPVQRGRTQQLWRVDITDESSRLVATGQVRLANVPDARALGGAATPAG